MENNKIILGFIIIHDEEEQDNGREENTGQSDNTHKAEYK